MAFTLENPPSQVTAKLRLARNLRLARTNAGLGVGEAAAAVGKSRQAYNAWEREDENAPMPGETDLQKLAELFGVTVETLRYRDLSPPPRVAEGPARGSAADIEPRYRGRDLPRLVEVIAKKFELEALETGATSEEMGVIRTTLYSSETVQMFHMGWDGAPMTEDEQRVEMEALTGKLRVWLKERIRRRTEASKKK